MKVTKSESIGGYGYYAHYDLSNPVELKRFRDNYGYGSDKVEICKKNAETISDLIKEKSPKKIDKEWVIWVLKLLNEMGCREINAKLPFDLKSPTGYCRLQVGEKIRGTDLMPCYDAEKNSFTLVKVGYLPWVCKVKTGNIVLRKKLK